jgi:hypothetical protein
MKEFSSPNTLRGTAFYLLPRATIVLSVAQALSRWKMRITARARGETPRRCAFPFESVNGGRSIGALQHAYPQPASYETTRANIQRGAGKNCSGSRTMDLFMIVIIAAMLLTVATVFLGLLTMSGGGSTNEALSTPLMWARVGFQALTILLLFIAIGLR